MRVAKRLMPVLGTKGLLAKVESSNNNGNIRDNILVLDFIRFYDVM